MLVHLIMMDYVEILVQIVDGAGLQMIQLNGILKMQNVDVILEY